MKPYLQLKIIKPFALLIKGPISDSLNFHSSLSLRLSGYSSIALRIEDRIHPLGVLVSVVGGISIAATAIALSSLSGEYR